MEFNVGDLVRISTLDPAFNGKVGPVERITRYKEDYSYHIRIEGFGFVSASAVLLEKVEDQ